MQLRAYNIHIRSEVVVEEWNVVSMYAPALYQPVWAFIETKLNFTNHNMWFVLAYTQQVGIACFQLFVGCGWVRDMVA